MKNLKKVLSLVLALAMALSLMTVAFAKDARDYTDFDEATYKEAVDVMSAIGVIDGMNGTTFAPDGTLTREQAAKIITYMLLGPDAAEKLGPQSTGFTDVPASRWSSPYVGYCVSRGIVNGTSATTFDPAGQLTGYAFAKMLLTAIGYGVNDEYVGSAWTLAVARDGMQIGLYDEVKVSNAVITRDEAAQLAFDALNTNQVVWSELFNTYTAYSVQLGTLAAKVFDLTPTFKDDGYHYTTRAWRQGNKVVTDYYNTDEIIATVTDADTTVGALLKDYEWQTKDSEGYALKIPMYVNGTQRDADALATLKGQSSSAKLLKNGYQVNLVDSDDNGEVDKVVVVVEYLAKVTRVNAATSSEDRSVNLDIYDTTGKVTKTKVETEDFAKDQYILIVPNSDNTAGFQEPLEMKAAKVVTGSVSAYYKETVIDGLKNADGSVTVDGTKYKYNSIFAYNEAALGENLSTDGYTLGSKASYNFYLDSLGNVIGVEVVDDSISDYAYIIYKGEDAFQRENIAKVLLSNGTVATYTISDDSDDCAYDDEGNHSDCAEVGEIYAYSINSANEIVLTELTGDYSQKANSSTNTINSFKKGNSVISYLGNSKVAYATDETVFVYYNANKVAGFYVGKDNAPDITSNQNASVAVKTDKGVDYAQFVVVTGAPAALTGSNYVYNLNSTYVGYSKDNNGDDAYYYEVIKDGEKVVIATDERSLRANTIYNYGVDEEAFGGDSANDVLAGLYDLTAMPASGYEAGVLVNVVNSGVIVGNSNAIQFVLAPETVVVDLDTTDSTSDITFKATVDKGDTITVVYDVVGGLNMAKAIYITDTGPNA